MGKDKNKEQDGELQPPPRASPAPAMPATPTGTSARREKHGTLP